METRHEQIMREFKEAREEARKDCGFQHCERFDGECEICASNR